ncbi:hypothetical protein K488DRAFT_84065 [Vararia minispora EC-137]|uniref:Uncharacterized protein n=1 Tax=Vararia minispora EC-137 TaxID=1314806 RepID=A0ACB8QSD4_9AGAM|nr:hypothetical protein K488DRAFT_84065 [Vararia minispora EC-137]
MSMPLSTFTVYARSDQSGSSSVSWISPSPGSSLSPGDTLMAQWTAERNIVSPSFKLCDDTGCGGAVWPGVTQSDNGVYSASVAIPGWTTDSSYYLEMKDDFGQLSSSPDFAINANGSASQSPVASDQSAQTPLAAPSLSTSVAPDKSSSEQDEASTDVSTSGDASTAHNAPKHTSSSNDSPPSSQPSASASSDASLPADETSPSVSGALSGVDGPVSGTPSPSPSSQGRVLPQSQHTLASKSNTPPVAAIAVPLSLSGVILLIAGLMAIHHRRQLVNDRDRREPPLDRGQNDTTRFLEAISHRPTVFSAHSPADPRPYPHVLETGAHDLEKAFLINALLTRRQSGPSLPSVYDHHRAAPHVELHRKFRQRTKDAYPFSQPVTPMSASPPYTTSSATDFYSSRPKPKSNFIISNPDGIASPGARTLDWVCCAEKSGDDISVTGGVLPSYLSSPDTDADVNVKPLPTLPTARFEDIPLSPRIPPVLHVRTPAPIENAAAVAARTADDISCSGKGLGFSMKHPSVKLAVDMIPFAWALVTFCTERQSFGLP